MVIQHQKNRKNQSINQSINKSDLTEIVKGGIKSEEQKIKTLCESREKGIKFFNDYSKIVSEAKDKTKYGEGLKISTPNQML